MTFPTLTVTSPHKKSQDVKDAQYLLAGNNRFKEKFYAGAVDGDFGPLTAAAAYRAKYYLGYPLGKCDHVFGPVLYSYLLPLTSGSAKKLPLLYQGRRKIREAAKKKQNQKTIGQKALDLGLTYVGYREGPAKNQNMFGAFFGINFNPWCGCFVSYCYTKSGKKIFWPYVPTLVADAEAGINGVFIAYSPKPGDLVCWDWGDGIWDHVEFVESLGSGVVNTLGGNTLPPGGSGDAGNGGGVYRNTRSDSIRHVFIRVAGAQ